MIDTPATSAEADRLAKVIARAGLCSRRDAEGWIKDGRVAVNGSVVRTPAFNVGPKDEIAVDGRPLAARQGTRLWLYHKPSGLVVTEKDPEGRPTIFEALAEEGLPRVLTVGRLDINTEGLLLLTNDGGLKRVLELPATGWLRRYRVRAFGKVTQEALDTLKAGIEVEGIRYGSIEAAVERQQGDNVWLTMALREGKNHEVKKVLGTLGLNVNRLIRVSYGPFQLGDLPVGGVDVVRARVLRDQLGDRLARQANVDFESDMPERQSQRGASAPLSDQPPPRRDRPGRGPEHARRAPRPAAAEPERPAGRPRTIHYADGRPPSEFVEKNYGKKPREDKAGGKPGEKSDRPRRAAGEGPKRDFKAGPKPDFKDRPKRDFKDGPKRDFKSSGPKRDFTPGAKPAFNDRPKRDFGDKPRTAPKRDFAARPGADRPKREFNADSPRPERKDRPPRPAGEGARPPRPAGDRPRSPRPPSDRPAGDRPRSPRPAGDGPRPPRPAGDRPRGPRPAGGAPRPPGARAPNFARSPRPGNAGKPRTGAPRPAGGQRRTGAPAGAGKPRPSGPRTGASRPGGDRPRGPKKPRA